MIHISGIYLLFMALVILFLGRQLTSAIPLLKRWHIPTPVTGGLLCSLLIALISHFTDLRLNFDLYLRDMLLLCFFSTIGLSARIRLLISGGKTLTTLMIIAIVFLILQNAAGVATALALGSNPIYGLLAGTITFAGGHGTAITWGSFLEQKGYHGAMEFGLIAATLGLILGGLVGGPIGKKLITRYRLHGPHKDPLILPDIDQENQTLTLNGRNLLSALFLISTCIIIGISVQGELKKLGVVLPDFVPVLFSGILITNICDGFKINLKQAELNMLGDVSLQLFIAMSLMTLKLHYLTSIAGVLMAITLVQVVVMISFAWFVVFQATGRDYDSSIITAGFIGMGLGATPVGMANMNTLVHRYGASPKAFLILPLIGSFFLDIANAIILKGFLLLPWFSAAG